LQVEVQRPSEQRSVGPQALPQPPQSVELRLVSTQASPHRTWGGGQPQTPSTQLSGAWQGMPQAPQLSKLLIRFTQIPSQRTSDSAQVNTTPPPPVLVAVEVEVADVLTAASLEARVPVSSPPSNTRLPGYP
jgi:hypothetical protein